MSIDDIKNKRNELIKKIESLKAEANKLENEVNVLQDKLERETFNGLSYYEYIKTFDKTTKEVGNYKVEYIGNNLYVRHKLENGVMLVYRTFVYADNSTEWFSAKYPSTEKMPMGKEVDFSLFTPIPQKYKNLFEEMKNSTLNLKITKP